MFVYEFVCVFASILIKPRKGQNVSEVLIVSGDRS